MRRGGTRARLAGALIVMIASVAAAHGAHAAAQTAKPAASTSGKSAAKSSTKSASKSAAPRDTSRVLVKVGRDPITRAMVQARIDQLPEQYRAQYSTPTGRQQILDRMIEEKVWLTVATKNGVADRPKVKEQLEQQRRDLLIRTWINEQMAGNPAPTDSDAKAYYDAHLGDYRSPATATVRHIQFKTETEARRVLALAKDPKKDWSDLVTKFTTDTLTRKNGGLLGTVTKDGVFPQLGQQPAMAESVFAMKDGQIAGPFKTDAGWHVIKTDRVMPESTRPFEQTKPLIMRQISGQRTQEYYKKLLEQARRDIGVKPDSEAIRDFVSSRRSARDMFKDAQEASGTQARLDGYRRVLETWPQSDVAPQAQFMIGFIQSEELKDYGAAEQSFRALLTNYPKSELGSSAQWMIDHMRTEEAPSFITQTGDSLAGTSPKAAGPASQGKRTGAPGKP